LFYLARDSSVSRGDDFVVDISELISRMSRLEHFKNLSAGELEAIIDIGRIRSFPENSRLFLEEEPCAGLFVLLSGQVHLIKISPQGQENVIGVICPVIMFNEVAVLDGGPNPVTAVTFKESVIWRASRERFTHVLNRYPKIALGLLPILASRNRWLIAQYEDLSFLSVRARTAKLLLELSDFGLKPINRREYSINDLAARVATVPEAISRSLSFFRDKQLISSSRVEIVVEQPQKLARIAQPGSDLV
jgi:CRP-like cAMP-binding protein